MSKVVITGANGFLGSTLCTYFQQRNRTVMALVHHLPVSPIAGVTYHQHDLSQEPEQDIFEGADCFIHCAYAKAAKGMDAFTVNIEGTKKLLEVSRKFGVKKNIFISSLASREDALSVYGKQKFAAEKLFNQADDLILRPGLILGKGGLFGQMRTYLQKSKLIPLISGGKQAMQTIYVNEVAQAIELCIQKNISGTLSIAIPEKLSYKEFYQLLCKSLNAKPMFISLPHSLLFAGLTISETIGIPLPINRENLLGLKKISHIDTTSDLAKIGIQLKSCEEVLNLL
ncbi:MAG TPA: NAD-dependent epimerase/dehydratase family protein [Bacteroidia bacterium]|jgi:nucleoside-diphosphate-sugar epimerase|nr:NAD-dependent epimerase/dehydratase family protein [Bacteroidia bacterium]